MSTPKGTPENWWREGTTLEIQKRVHSLRARATPAEKAMINILKRMRFGRQKVRYVFQRPIEDKKNKRYFIVDFYLTRPYRTVIEIDGGYHYEEPQFSYDRMRENWLKLIGNGVIRFDNKDVLHNSRAVIYELREFLIERKPIVKAQRKRTTEFFRKHRRKV